MKRISFFHILRGIILVTGLYLTMFGISFVLVSYAYFNHDQPEIRYVDNVEVYREEEIRSFRAYFKRDMMFVLITLVNEKDDTFLLEYAYHYFHAYGKAICLEVTGKEGTVYVNISQDGYGTIS